jgi:hypothetical protein
MMCFDAKKGRQQAECKHREATDYSVIEELSSDACICEL